MSEGYGALVSSLKPIGLNLLAARNYDVFWSQVGLGMAEFSDMPLTLPVDRDTYRNIFKAKHVTRYLNDYVDQKIFQRKSSRDHIRFGFKVKHCH